MVEKNPNRESYFPAIEKKYGQPMSYWFAQISGLADEKYTGQISFLKEDHGFSQAHANAVDTVEDYLSQFDAVKVKTVKSIFRAITSKHKGLELVIAWNQPMLRLDGQYIFGVTVLTNHILMAPWSKDVLEKFAPRLKDYEVNKKTIGVPVDWKVDVKLLQDMAKARIAEVDNR
jgi:uncharacterized protein YdhG (YjbR/CyaY superfamily)